MSRRPADPAEIEQLLATIHRQVGERTVKSLTPIRRVLSAARKLGRKDWEGVALRLEGDVARHRCNFEQAIGLYRLAMPMLLETGNPEEIGICWNGMGSAYWYMGELDLALEAFIHTSGHLEQTGLIRSQAHALNNVGIIFGIRNEHDRALEYFLQALEIYNRLGDRNGIANTSINLGSVHEGLGDLDTALEKYLIAEALYTTTGNLRTQGYVQTTLGSLLRKMDRPLDAVSRFERALDLGTQAGDRFGIAQAGLHLALARLDAGQAQQALGDLRGSLRLARAMKARELEKDICLAFCALFEKQRRYKSALIYHKRASGLQTELHDEAAQKRVAELHTRFETEKKDREREIYRLRNIELAAKQEEIEKQQAALAETNRELTERNRQLKESYEALEKAQAEIIELERRYSVYAMAVTANHELNQPLMILSGNLDMLEMALEAGKSGPDTNRYLLRSREALLRINDILSELRRLDEVRISEYSSQTPMVVLNTEEMK